MSQTLLHQELAAVGGKNPNAKLGRKASKKENENLLNISSARGREKRGIPGSPKVNIQMSKVRPQKPQRVEPLVKEEGEMSDHEEVYEQFKEVKWMEWCADVMADEIKTLQRLQRLQTTSADLPKEKVQPSSGHSFFHIILCPLNLCIHHFFSRCFQKFGIIYSFLDEALIKLS